MLGVLNPWQGRELVITLISADIAAAQFKDVIKSKQNLFFPTFCQQFIYFSLILSKNLTHCTFRTCNQRTHSENFDFEEVLTRKHILTCRSRKVGVNNKINHGLILLSCSGFRVWILFMLAHSHTVMSN